MARKPQLVYSRRHDRQRWSEASDRELLTALARGEEGALDPLMERKTGPLLQLALRMVGDREEARDIVQLTFLRVWEHRQRFNDRWTPNTWLYRITTNLAIDFLRSRKGRQRKAEPVRHHLFGVVESRRRRELADLDRREIERVLRELASGLSERQRAAFLLREVEGLSSSEVAHILGCRESTVRNHLHTARKTLRRELLRRYPEYAGDRGTAEEEP